MSSETKEKDSLISSDLVKSSFFDDIKEVKPIPSSPKEPFLWLHPSDPQALIPEEFDNSGQILVEGPLLSRSKKTNSMKKRFYVLKGSKLFCYKNAKKEKERRILKLQGLKLEVFDQIEEEEEEEKNEMIDKKKGEKENEALERQCFFVSRNKKYDILFAQEKNDYQKWLEQLKKQCILTYFGKYYTNLKVIGKGTFAKVILSKRICDNKDFAIKTFDKKSILASKSANRTRVGLINEINIMRSLNHPNVIKMYEVYEGDYHIYLVLELLKGGELFDRIVKKGHYSEKDAAILISKLLWALEYIHEKGIMHRDIKPENLILKDENEYEIKLADFGLAERVDKKELLFKRCGTPGYVAPEVLEDKKYDTKVDVYSAGVILYILLTGCSPFYGKSYNEILAKNKSGSVNYNFEEIKIVLTKEAVDLLKKMLEKDPKTRITASQALKHPWIQHYMTSDVKEGLTKSQAKEENLNSVQENMKKFQETRMAMKPNKPEDMIVNSPLITGRTDAIYSKTDSPMGSPLLSAAGGIKRENKNISEIHKKVLLKNVAPPTKSTKTEENDDISDELSPIDTNIKKLKNEEKPYRPSIDPIKTSNNYVASPLGKKPRGSIDDKKFVGGQSPVKNSQEVKVSLQKMEKIEEKKK